MPTVEFIPGERVSAAKLNQVSAMAESGDNGPGYTGGIAKLRKRKGQLYRGRGIIVNCEQGAPFSAISAPKQWKAYELQWIEERQRLVVVDDQLVLLHVFDPDLTNIQPGFYVKFEDIGDGINEIYYSSCNIANTLPGS